MQIHKTSSPKLCGLEIVSLVAKSNEADIIGPLALGDFYALKFIGVWSMTPNKVVSLGMPQSSYANTRFLIALYNSIAPHNTNLLEIPATAVLACAQRHPNTNQHSTFKVR
jgi:hypothetical protein